MSKREALVIVHGMGEQIPMSTLRSFVESSWVHDDTLIDRNRQESDTGITPRRRNPVWSHPDGTDHGFELRRLTTERNDAGRQIDFHEFYWADLMPDTTLEHVRSWVFHLLLRPVSKVPEPLRPTWIALWALTSIYFGCILMAILYTDKLSKRPWAHMLVYLAGLAFGFFTSEILVKRFGDVARYVRAEPENVQRRRAIKERGVALLERLHRETVIDQHGRQVPKYDRIVVVGHSLGTIVAYDVLHYAFSRFNRDHTPDRPQPKRAALEAAVMAGASGSPVEIDRFQSLQADALDEIVAQGHPWRVRDFITLGSPLTHAAFLLAEDEADLRTAQQRRVLATCPPLMELDLAERAYHLGVAVDKLNRKPEDPRRPHDAALFAYTRWTNLYSPHQHILKGDIVSGPVADPFGWCHGQRIIHGVKDIPVMTGSDDTEPSWLTHCKYWDAGGTTGDGVPEHIKVLRSVLRFGA